ncbi:MAG: collagenase [Gammaproteobacteria bacterium]|nr:collagenase [Gammaproteobacteria bacterium]
MKKLILAIICAVGGLAAHAQDTAGVEYECDFAPLLTLTGWGWLDHMAELYLNYCEGEFYTDPPNDLMAYFGEDAVSEAVAAAQSVVDVYRWEVDWSRLGGAFEYIAAGQHYVRREAVEAWSAELYDDLVTLVTTFADDEEFLFPSSKQGWAVRSLFRAADNPATRLQAMSQFHHLVSNWRPGLANDTSYVQAMYAATELMRNAHAHDEFVATVEALGDLPDVMAEMVISATDWVVGTTGYSLMIAGVADELGKLLEYTEASFALDIEGYLQDILDHPKILPLYDPTIVRNVIFPGTGAWANDSPMRGYMIYAAVADTIERLGRCDDFYGVYGDGQNTPCQDRATVINQLFPVDTSHECTLNGESLNVKVRTQANGVFHVPKPIVNTCGDGSIHYWVELDSQPNYRGTGCGESKEGGVLAECTNWVRFYPDDQQAQTFVPTQAEFDRLTERRRKVKLDQLCDVVAAAKDGFEDVFGDGLDPVADDNNTELEVVMFEDDYEYASYVRWLFGGTPTALGSFVEGDPSQAADTEERTPSRVLTYPVGDGSATMSVAEDNCHYAGPHEVYDAPVDAIELKRETARYYDGRYNHYGVPNLEGKGFVWWDDGVAQHVKVGGRVRTAARDLAMGQDPMALSEVLTAMYNDRVFSDHYWWVQLAVQYLVTEQPDSVEFILQSTRTGDYEEAIRYVGLMGAAFGDDWATWLADIVSEGLESTESAIDGEIEENNLAEGWDETGGDGDGTSDGATDG